MSLYSDIILDFTRSTNKSVLNAAWLLKNIAPGIILTNIDKAVKKKSVLQLLLCWKSVLKSLPVCIFRCFRLASHSWLRQQKC